MARKLYVLTALFLLIFLSSFVPLSIASPKKKAPPSAARKEDIQYIKCQVCEKIAQQIYNQVKGKESKISPKKISEYEVIEIAENVCNLKKAEADWILQIDIVEKGDKLELVEQGVEGQCNSECKTIERACQEILGYSDTDVAEYVFSSKPSLDSLVNFLCNDLSKACVVKAPPVPKARVPGEPFVAKPTKDAEMEKILRSMEKKALSQKTTPKYDIKEKILRGIKVTRNTIKGHVNKALKKIRNWWKRRKAASKSSKSSKKEL
ncbi:hypothetical protein MA16_Dca024935 [Dendrobium catenatum]|uniref:Saposin B-type domain-containing protein n=1 Tax=Dendrobium catenatum TaxID=906689 RepID=A0A2I0VX71_9ASPA|nr:hypothetical protein MA16_Dca024935 [Dendrobium catenatum]